MRYRTWFFSALAVLLIVVAWHQVFMMTGILWWNAPQLVQQQAPPAPLELRPLDTQLIDLEAWQKTYPVWGPMR